MSDKTAILFDIKKYALHDGPGIRTTVFLKGCPLACWWCHNPEGISIKPHLIYDLNRCIGCTECIEACPNTAISFTKKGLLTDPVLCRQCGVCAEICPAEARQLAGKNKSVEDLINIIKKDTPFYDESGGGVTFSGGEPLMQPEVLLRLLKECGRLCIHRALDTTGFADADTLRRIAKETDLFLFDLKFMNSANHKKYTGVYNEKILSNLEMLAKEGSKITIRIPLIPGVNDDDENIEQTGVFVSALPGVKEVHLLPFHDFQKNKYKKFGMAYPAEDIRAPEPSRVLDAVKILEKFELLVTIGG
jgi:pyruvate formate lyase activating enzyme